MVKTSDCFSRAVLLYVDLQQLGVGSLLEDVTLVEADDTVAVLDGGEAVSDHQCASLRVLANHAVESGLDNTLGLRVEC